MDDKYDEDEKRRGIKSEGGGYRERGASLLRRWTGRRMRLRRRLARRRRLGLRRRRWRCSELERIRDAGGERALALFEARVVELGEVGVVGDLEEVARDVEELLVAAHAVAGEGVLQGGGRESGRAGEGEPKQRGSCAPCTPSPSSHSSS